MSNIDKETSDAIVDVLGTVQDLTHMLIVELEKHVPRPPPEIIDKVVETTVKLMKLRLMVSKDTSVN